MNQLLRLKLAHLKRRFIHFFFNRPLIKSEKIVIGKNVVFGKNIKIYAKNVKIGNGCVIGDNVIIHGEKFIMGDYGKIYQNCFFPGGSVIIGHNFWLGVDSIIDGRAGTIIGDNVGIGAQSQLWTHMVFGDMMQGCRFHSEAALTIGNDVWLAGHNLVSPVTIGNKSLAMLGSLITRDMLEDRVYAGSPAKDLTEKLGRQFEEPSVEEKKAILIEKLIMFSKKFNLGDYSKFIIVYTKLEHIYIDTNLIQINVARRTYKKTNSILEYYLLYFLLPDVKLLPE